MKAVASSGVSQMTLLMLYQTLMLLVIDYGFGLMTLADIQLKRLYTIQNEAYNPYLLKEKNVARGDDSP